MKKIKPAKSDLFSVSDTNRKLLSFALYTVIFFVVIVISKSALDSQLNSKQEASIKNTVNIQTGNGSVDYGATTDLTNNEIDVSAENTERLRLAVELKRKAEGLPKSNAKSQFFAILNTSIDDGVITERELDILSHALANAENYR